MTDLRQSWRPLTGSEVSAHSIAVHKTVRATIAPKISQREKSDIAVVLIMKFSLCLAHLFRHGNAMSGELRGAGAIAEVSLSPVIQPLYSSENK
jgi:hypothetical protein